MKVSFYTKFVDILVSGLWADDVCGQGLTVCGIYNSLKSCPYTRWLDSQNKHNLNCQFYRE